jgi:ribonuclease HI
MSSKKQPVANQDLLVQLAQLKEHHDVAAVWVRSHTKKTDMNSLGNAVVDEFAQILTR